MRQWSAAVIICAFTVLWNADAAWSQPSSRVDCYQDVRVVPCPGNRGRSGGQTTDDNGDDQAKIIRAALTGTPGRATVGTRSFSYFDLTIEGLCDGPGSLNGRGLQYLQGATSNFIWKEKRTVALVVTVDSGNGSPVKIPLLVMEPTTGEPVVGCNPLLVTGVPRGQSVSLKFEFYVSDKTSINPGFAGFLTSAAGVVTALYGLDLTFFSWASVATARAGQATALQVALDRFLQQFDAEDRAPTITHVIDTNTLSLSFKSGRSTIFSVAKKTAISRLMAGDTWPPNQDILVEYKRVYGESPETAIQGLIGMETDVYTTPAKIPLLCAALSRSWNAKGLGNIDRLIMTYWYSSNRVFISQQAGGCLADKDVRQLSGFGFQDVEAYAIKRAAPPSPDPTVQQTAKFARAEQVLTDMSADIKSLRMDIDRAAALQEEGARVSARNRIVANMADYFSGQVRISGDGVAFPTLTPSGLLPTKDFASSTEVVGYMVMWPQVQNFGCFVATTDETLKSAGIVAEGLFKLDAPSSPLVRFFVSPTPSGKPAITRLSIQGADTAGVDDILTRYGGQECGRGGNRWKPKLN